MGLFGSVLLHAAVLAGMLFTWQHRLDIADEAPPVVPVELVTIGDKTNIKAVAPKDEFKPKEQQPLEAPKVQPTPTQTVQASTPDVDTAEPAPAPSEPQIKPKQSVPAIVPQMRPEPPKPEQKKQKFDVNNILALLNKQKPASANAPKGATGAQPRRGIGAQSAMTMDLVDALRNEIAQCWSPPVGAPHASDLVVVFEVYLNPDGSVARPPQLTASSAAAASGNPYTRAAAEAARRAIYTCAPYKLPANRYSDWHDIEIQFDPRQMMGQ